MAATLTLTRISLWHNDDPAPQRYARWNKARWCVTAMTPDMVKTWRFDDQIEASEFAADLECDPSKFVTVAVR